MPTRSCPFPGRDPMSPIGARFSIPRDGSLLYNKAMLLSPVKHLNQRAKEPSQAPCPRILHAFAIRDLIRMSRNKSRVTKRKAPLSRGFSYVLLLLFEQIRGHPV